MKKTKLLICFMLALVMVMGALPAFATETETTEAVTENTQDVTEAVTDETKPTEETTEEGATEETVTTGAPAQTPTPELSTDETCTGATSKNGKHSYEAWEMNDEYHWHRCKHCQKYFGDKHGGSDTYKNDSELHWYYCGTCKKKYCIENHSFEENMELFQKECTLCHKIVEFEHEHIFEETWSHNAYEHYHACTSTFGLKGTEFCPFDAIHNDVCDAEEHDFDMSGICTICKIDRNKIDPNATEHEFDENGYCAYCQVQYENVSDLTPHDFDENGICKVCKAQNEMTELRSGDEGVHMILFIVIGVVGALSVAAVFLFYKKK